MGRRGGGLQRCGGPCRWSQQGGNLQRDENENSVQTDFINLDPTLEESMPGGSLSAYEVET